MVNSFTLTRTCVCGNTRINYRGAIQNKLTVVCPVLACGDDMRINHRAAIQEKNSFESDPIDCLNLNQPNKGASIFFSNSRLLVRLLISITDFLKNDRNDFLRWGKTSLFGMFFNAQKIAKA